MSDRELLKLAAKAGWHDDARYVDGEGWMEVRYGLSEGMFSSKDDCYWNPLEDDGDALRLAVTLRLGIEWWKNGASAETPQLGPSGIQQFNGDPYAATRRAIVRAAAEIGKAMP